jgi:hypothetical protein
VGACVKRVQPHTILRKTPRGLRFKQNRIETSIQNRNHHQHHGDLTVIDHTHNASKSRGVCIIERFLLFFWSHVKKMCSVTNVRARHVCVFDTKSLDQMAEIL